MKLFGRDLSANYVLPQVTISEHDRVRYLHLGSIWVQGAMRLDDPKAIELEYVRRMMAWMLWRDSVDLAAGHAVQLGLGAGAITRFTRRALKMRTTAVEINPQVILANRTWFRLPRDDAKLSVVMADARAWVDDDANTATVDVLCVDLYDHDAARPVLDDEPFYAACRRVLADGGVMTVNLFGRKASFAASARRIAAAFGVDQVWHLGPTREGNTVVVAGRGVVVPDRDTLEARAATIERSYGLPALQWLHMVRPLRLDPRLR
jgi:spermidine synthase